MALTKISTAMISQSAAAVDLNVDAGTFYVDTTNNRVGVGGKTDPDTPLQECSLNLLAGCPQSRHRSLSVQHPRRFHRCRHRVRNQPASRFSQHERRHHRSFRHPLLW